MSLQSTLTLSLRNLVLALASSTFALSSQASDLELRASLSGYGLLWPSSRCCAFDLHVLPTGRAKVTIKTGSTLPADHADARRVSEFRLSVAEIESLRIAIERADFFSLPERVGPRPPDGDERAIEVRMGGRSHRVLLTGWGMSPSPEDHPPEMERALSLWSVIRPFVKDPEVSLP